MTRGDVQFRNGRNALSMTNMEAAERVEVRFRASRNDQNREGAEASRFRTPQGQQGEWKDLEGFGTLAGLLKRHATLPSEASPRTSNVEGTIQGTARPLATRALRSMVAGTGEGLDPMASALHPGRIGGATRLAQAGASVI